MALSKTEKPNDLSASFLLPMRYTLQVCFEICTVQISFVSKRQELLQKK